MLEIVNPKTNLSKVINTSDYTFEEVDKIIVFYTKIGWKVRHIFIV